MRPFSWRLVVFAVMVGLEVACGSSSNNPNNPSSPGTTNVFTLTVDGTSSTLNSNTITATPSSAVPGSVVIAGSTNNGTGSSLSVSIALGFLNGPGTYPLGVNQATTPGGSVSLQFTGSGTVSNWLTPFSGAAGSVTITTLTATQIAGTFQASVPPIAPATGTHTISAASFNVGMSGFVPATAANPGNTLTATVGGTPFVGGTVVGTATGGGFAINAISTTPAGVVNSVTLTSGQTAVGSFPFFSTTTPAITVTIVRGQNTAGGGASSDTGTVTISSVSGGLITGTFSGTLSPSPGLAIANGAFTIKLH